MKRIFTLLVAFSAILSARSQYHYNKTISFESYANLVEIDTSQKENTCQIGIPQKLFLDSAYSTPYAIITDAINAYPVNNHSSFQVKIYSPPESCWGIGRMMFKHRYDLELNKDGGFIEVRYDDDTTWTNIIFDQDPEEAIYFDGYYYQSDTIPGGIPAFTGKSASWTYPYIEWIWFLGEKSPLHDSLTIRFTVKSDSVQTNQEGWLIDDILLQLEDCTGNTVELGSNRSASYVYPNPVENTSVLKFENSNGRNTRIEVLDMNGKIVLNTTLK